MPLNAQFRILFWILLITSHDTFITFIIFGRIWNISGGLGHERGFPGSFHRIITNFM